MTASTRWRQTMIVAVVFVGLGVFASAETFPECAARAYAQAASASQEWQHGLRDFIVKGRPELATPATMAMEHQLALTDRRQAQFQYLLRTDAARVQTTDGLAAFRNFDWTEADARALRQQSASYVTLERNVVELQRQAQERQDGPALRDYVRTSLSASPPAQELLKQFQERERAIEPLLKSCQTLR